MELLTKLGINWQLLIAQIINFSIVVGVLGYFLFRPILNLLDSRTERIRKSMEDAKRIENQVKEMEEIRERELKKLSQETGALFEKARKDAEVIQQQLVAAAKKEAESILTSATKRIAEERRQMMEEVMASVRQIVLTMAEKIIEREFSPADQKRIAESFTQDLPALFRS